jgi:excisionase family DNA binding protein
MSIATFVHPSSTPQPRYARMLHDYTRLKPQPGPEGADRSIAPAVLTIREACAVLKISKWTLYRLIHSRQLKTVKIGSRRVVPVESIRRLVSNLSEEHV